ncbi:MAG: HAD family hydrolase, partial [Granulosicoccus sp.]
MKKVSGARSGESRHRPRLIAVDCDGTFFDSDGYPSTRTCEVVRRVVDAGHHIVAVTGRSRLTACERLAAVPGMHYIVCSNGAYAWDMRSGMLLWEQVIPEAQVVHLVERLLHAMPDATFGWESRYGIGFDAHFVGLAGGIGQLETGGVGGDDWSQDLYKLKVRRQSAFDNSLRQTVATILDDSACEIATSGAPFVEITAKNSHKGTGLERTAQLLGFTADSVIAFGDNNNDLPMLRWAGLAVAMGNALDEVCTEAHDGTLSNTEHGVAVYLERLLY